jgi:peptidoglycan hydrolase-like protein with peptidoglycan-binding domain
MMPNAVSKLPAPQQARFNLAYTNKLRPIGWWEPDDICVGVVQVWMHILGEHLPKSVKVDGGGDLICDGIFGPETYAAVFSFQGKNSLKRDGMVGHDTLDMITHKLPRTNPPAPTTRNAAVTVAKRPYRCPDGMLICPEP